MTALRERWFGSRARKAERDATSAPGLRWDSPARTVSVAGVHGGCGATTLCLLLAHAVARFGSAPALVVDLAGRGRGGLAVLGGACSQTPAEAAARVAASDGGSVARPFGVNDAGVHIIGTHPDGIDELDRTCETLVGRLVYGIDRGADNSELGRLVREAVRDDVCWQAVRWDNEQVVEAVARVLDEAFAHHALVVVDLGMLDSAPLARTVAVRSDLHVWVLPGRARSLEIAARRLPLLCFESAGREAIAVWHAGEAPLSPARLSALGDARGCPVVRVANHGGDEGDWQAPVLRCLSGVAELCELAR